MSRPSPSLDVSIFFMVEAKQFTPLDVGYVCQMESVSVLPSLLFTEFRGARKCPSSIAVPSPSLNHGGGGGGGGGPEAEGRTIKFMVWAFVRSSSLSLSLSSVGPQSVGRTVVDS